MDDLARLLIIFGVLIAVIGGVLLVVGRTGVPIGRLPGDFSFSQGGLTCFFPLATSLILSIILTILLNLAIQFFRK